MSGAADPRLPWPATAAALVSFAALALTGERFIILGALGLTVALASASRLRLPAGAVVPWLCRVILWTIIIAANVTEPVGGIGYVYYDPSLVHAAGQLCAAELAIQAWRPSPSGGPEGAYAILLSSLVFLVACNEMTARHIDWLAPAYTLFLALAARRIGGAGLASSRRRRTPLVIAGLVLAVVLATGSGSAWLLHRYMPLLNEYSFLLMQRFMTEAPQIGFTGAPQLGRTSGMNRSLTRVLRVEGRVHDPHLRGMAFDTYHHGRWTPTLEGRRFFPLAATALSPQAPGELCRFTRLADEPDVLFLPLDCTGVRPRGAETVQWDTAQGSCIRVPAPPPYDYECTLPGAAGELGPLDQPPSAEQRARDLAVSDEIEPSVRALAREIAGDVVDPLGRASAVERYLQRNHAYSLSTDPGSGDPVSRFLLLKKSAHCEYFASAAVVLLRCLGVPSRYVVGFYAHEWAGPDAWIVREQDAHAWCESWIEGRGWVTVEATPAEGCPDRTGDEVSLWRRAWERLRDMAVAAWAGAAEQGAAHLGLILIGGASALIVLRGVADLWRRRRARLRGDHVYASPGVAFIAFATRFEALLDRKGVGCPPGRTWREHLTLLAAPDAGVRPTLDLERARSLVVEYTRLRFGAAPDAGTIAALAKRLKDLER